jgi:hypothetical protein
MHERKGGGGRGRTQERTCAQNINKIKSGGTFGQIIGNQITMGNRQEGTKMKNRIQGRKWTGATNCSAIAAENAKDARADEMEVQRNCSTA